MWLQDYWPTEYWPEDYWSKTGMLLEGIAIERKTGAGGSWAEINRVPLGEQAYNDMALTPATEYFYRVRQFSTLGFSDYSNEDSATTDP